MPLVEKGVGEEVDHFNMINDLGKNMGGSGEVMLYLGFISLNVKTWKELTWKKIKSRSSSFPFIKLSYTSF